MGKSEISLSVNGNNHSVTVEDCRTLADFIREDLQLMGTKIGCNQGVCGSCTVLLDGVPVRACLTLASICDGRSIDTVESHDKDEDLAVLQEEFIRHGAVQCGFCTPGMLMTSIAFLRRNHSPTFEEIKHELSGNLCRCTGYHGAFRAISSFAAQSDSKIRRAGRSK